MSTHILDFFDRIFAAFGWGTVTVRMSDQFGPPPAVRWPELFNYSDEELYERPLSEIITEIERDRMILGAAARERVR